MSNSKFRVEMTPEEQRDFLTHTRLFLSKDVRRTLLKSEVYALKHTPTANYLHVSSEELFILGCFGRGSTVSELVPSLIMNRRCPPLRDLYELILQARNANILNEVRDEEFAPVFPPRWWPSLEHNTVQAVWWLSAIAAVVAFCLWTSEASISEAAAFGKPVNYLAAYVVLAVCASLGSLLASAYVHRVGCDVQRPRLVWKTLLPRIGFDWTDGLMGGESIVVEVAKLRIIPFLFVTALATALPFFGVAGFLHDFAPFLLIGLLWRISPYPGGSAVQWLEARYRIPLVSVKRGRFFYHGAHTVSARVLEEYRATHWRYAGIMAVYSALWSCLVIWFVGVLVNPIESWSSTFKEMFSRESYGIIEVFGLSAGLLFLGILAMIVYGWYRMKAVEANFGRIGSEQPVATGGGIPETFDESLLFRELSVELRGELAQYARTITIVSGSLVVEPGQRGEDLYMVQSGEFEILMTRAKGRPEVVARLKRGDVFGELNFFGGLFRPHKIRAKGTGTLIAMSDPIVEQTLKRNLSIPAIEEIVQKRTFLRRIPLSCGWQPHSIARFAKACRMEEMKEGQLVIGTGRENRFFYLVHEGDFEVRHRGRRIARIRGGDFFGEISLLLNNLATADIIAVEPTKCLVLQKSDFLNLMGQDVELALQMEYVASVRFGRPIFPFEGSSLEGLAN